MGHSELTSAQILHTSLSLQQEDSPVLFIREHQCPCSGASCLVSFGWPEEDDNDAMSLAASDVEEWSKPGEDSATLPQIKPDDSQPGLDSKLIQVLSNAFEELGLKWSAPAEPTCSCLNEGLLQPGHHQRASCQRPAPFFPDPQRPLRMNLLWSFQFRCMFQRNSGIIKMECYFSLLQYA